MATLDVARTAVRLADDELGTAVMLVAAPDHDSLSDPGARAALDRLRAGGILTDGGLVGYVARLVAVVAAPKLRITVERFVGRETIVEQAWATEREGVLGAVCADGQIELSAVEPSLLPWAIARAVGLGPRERAAVARSLTIEADAFGGAAVRAATAPQDADALLRDGTRLDAAERAAVLAALVGRRSSWRATSVWTDARGERRLSSVAVLDGGEGGLWLTGHEGEGADAVVCLEPVAPSVVWRRIEDLMPHPDSEAAG